ncbi:hypothetical protein BH24CHL6_BH24CHL6_04570 [soil metagenome]
MPGIDKKSFSDPDEIYDFCLIRPGHRAWVLGEENCVLIDW